MTDEQTKAHIAALIQERRHYETHGQSDRVAMVDAELEKLGAQGKPPAKRATRAKPKARTEI